MHSNVIKEEDAEIYIYGINQILVSVLNVSSALIIGWIFGAVLEIAVFMAAYIPLRTFAGGYHSKTPLRCYMFSIIILIFVSVCMKYFCTVNLLHYIVSASATLILLIRSPIEDINKPLGIAERKIYKKRALFIMIVEIVIGLFLKMMSLDSLFVSLIYTFMVLCFMLAIGIIKNQILSKKE